MHMYIRTYMYIYLYIYQLVFKFNFFIYIELIFVAEWYSNSTLHLYMDPADLEKFAGKEHVMIIQNHSYEIDWLCGWMFADKVQCLGNCKAYAKKAISYVPVMGWAWKFAEFVFLERSFDKDSEIIARQLKEVFAYPDPTWLLLNAEGTRFTPKKHEACVKFAEERGLPLLKHHLTPRTKGFTTSLPTMRGRCAAIYDTNLAFRKDAKNDPTISTLLNGYSVEGHLFARRIPLEMVPEGEKEAAEWLHNLYKEKDSFIDSFHRTGNFFEASGQKPVPVKVFPYRPCSLINFALWAVFSVTVVLYYLISSLLAQNWIGFSIAVGVLVTCKYSL
ncbi:unnamed protein product [Ceratitis capitata]|uniref:(Mediterranean fruit fly) hypothetical protein n=1 Tax=Ceratitis capitata TaxID=7213 RepID=A0A811UT38_CERCA|nr:unnamed protein product [Ceratitis capitata]